MAALMGKLVVAIDGPAGAGKSTTAKAVAKALGYVYLDTGAMYRAVALAATRGGIDVDDAEASVRCAECADVRQASSPSGGTRTYLGDEDVSEHLRTPAVSAAASKIATHTAVRRHLVQLQQGIGEVGGVVLEGRDTTTAIFPDAACKVFLDASVAERVRRRRVELEAKGEAVDDKILAAEISERDARDQATQEQLNGAWPNPEATLVDSTGLSVEQQVERIIELAKLANLEPKI